MATLITCDRCKLQGKQVEAHFRVRFELIADGEPADHPQDLCKAHYEQFWVGL